MHESLHRHDLHDLNGIVIRIVGRTPSCDLFMKNEDQDKPEAYLIVYVYSLLSKQVCIQTYGIVG